MTGKGKLTGEQKKTLVKILAFHALEKGIIKNYSLRKLGRIRRLIKRKWKKILPLISSDQLIIEKGKDTIEAKKAIDLLILYSKLYTDLIDEYAMKSCNECIRNLMKDGRVPSLKQEFEDELLKIISIRPGPKKEGKATVKRPVLRDFPHLSSDVRRKLVKHFKRRLRESEPLIMLDSGLQLRIDNFIRRHVDRIIDVFLEHSYKAIQHGYITRSSDKLSLYVEQKGMESIDWTIENGVIVDELVQSMS